MMNWLVVTPSVRPFRPEFFEPLEELDWMIVDDTDGKVDFVGLLKDRKNKPIIATEALMKAELGEVAYKLIPRHNPSCKNFGLWWAWAKGYDGVILLDDDCDVRHTPDYINRIPVGKDVVGWLYETPSGWYNTMCQLVGTDRDFFARGYPYEHRAEQLAFVQKIPVTSKFNEGLWVGTPDINGADKLQRMEQPGFDASLPPWRVALSQQDAIPETVALRAGQYLPLSIMNVQLARELIPAFYQPPDWNVYSGFKIRRHDDVYSMLVLKSLMDLKGDIVTTGNPLIHHTKEGNVNREILSEHCTHLLQPYLMGVVQEAAQLLSPHTDVQYGPMAERLGLLMERIIERSKCVPGHFAVILSDYAQRITHWARLCNDGPQSLERRLVPVDRKLL